MPTWLNRARLADRPRSGEFARPSLAGEADLGASASTISAGRAGVDNACSASKPTKTCCVGVYYKDGGYYKDGEENQCVQ